LAAALEAGGGALDAGADGAASPPQAASNKLAAAVARKVRVFINLLRL
jgi:hypothetical protein